MEEIKQVFLNGLGVYPFTSEDQLIDYIDAHKGVLVAVNAAKIMHDVHLTGDLINRNIGYCDGSGPVLALKQRGYKEACKIAGCDLWLRIIGRFVDSKKFYLVGGKQEIIDKTVEKLRQDFPAIDIAGYRNGFIANDDEKKALLADIEEKKPDVVFVAMGSPKQEYLMEEMQKRNPDAIYQGLGGSFDVYTGAVKRAPKWWVDHNLEFAYRVINTGRLRRNKYVFQMAWWLLLGKFKAKNDKASIVKEKENN